MKSWRVADALNGGMEALNGAAMGLYAGGRRFA